MEKAKKEKMVLLVSAIVSVFAAVIIIIKAIATDSSPTQGLIFLSFGLFWLVFALTRKSKNDNTNAS